MGCQNSTASAGERPVPSNQVDTNRPLSEGQRADINEQKRTSMKPRNSLGAMTLQMDGTYKVKGETKRLAYLLSIDATGNVHGTARGLPQGIRGIDGDDSPIVGVLSWPEGQQSGQMFWQERLGANCREKWGTGVPIPNYLLTVEHEGTLTFDSPHVSLRSITPFEIRSELNLQSVPGFSDLGAVLGPRVENSSDAKEGKDGSEFVPVTQRTWDIKKIYSSNYDPRVTGKGSSGMDGSHGGF